jgi:hypothetical protein
MMDPGGCDVLAQMFLGINRIKRTNLANVRWRWNRTTDQPLEKEKS